MRFEWGSGQGDLIGIGWGENADARDGVPLLCLSGKRRQAEGEGDDKPDGAADQVVSSDTGLRRV
jgi:hypothetical protein